MQSHDLKIRITTDMRDRLKLEARSHSRTMNGEVVEMLKLHLGVPVPRKRLVLRKPAKAGA